ncbi:Cupredoxin [Guyanagaster necrorhizus]|uniref:Cupredoxin n=1 Tax=Guyanagaster necrorhizus TaxID=856835 RepID=A0A9P8AQR0_9AGAR|nr:Cupredoxin [Guyanagaster necrorhizus MCA 3950]KAG7444603.1 Cupredoxin [Guyanagaster necrorhizus MCA 3950]
MLSGASTYNYENPVRRDVVSTGNKGDVTIRFRTDNPGPWFLHYRIDWHLEAGLAVIFAEDAGDWNSVIDPTCTHDDLCPKYSSLTPEDL